MKKHLRHKAARKKLQKRGRTKKRIHKQRKQSRLPKKGVKTVKRKVIVRAVSVVPVVRSHSVRPSPPLIQRSHSVTRNPEAVPTHKTWPDLPIYVITINPARFSKFQKRSTAISSMVHRWNGTNGSQINRKTFHKETNASLRRGEIGCYDSHVRLWRHMVDHNIPLMMICEDDANINGNERQTNIITRALNELKTMKWDLAFISWDRPGASGAPNRSSMFKRQWTFCQLFSYLINIDTAKFLLNSIQSKRYMVPVDVMLFNLHKANKLKNVVLFPSLSVPIPEISDTVRIR